MYFMLERVRENLRPEELDYSEHSNGVTVVTGMVGELP